MVMVCCILHREIFFFFFSSRRRHTRLQGDWSSDVCSSDLLVSLGSVNRVWLSFWGLLLVVGVIGLGILVPLGLHMKPTSFGGLAARPIANAAKLVLLGGFLLRLATMLASEGIERYRVAAGI